MLKGRKYLMVYLLRTNSKKCSRFLVYCCIINGLSFCIKKCSMIYPIVICSYVLVIEVSGRGKFYVQLIEDQRIASIQQQLSFLNLQEARAFNPKKGDMVLCLFGADKSWYRAMVSSYF